MKLKLVAAVSALAISALAHAEQSGPQPAVPKPTKADGQKVVQIITSDKSLRILHHYGAVRRTNQLSRWHQKMHWCSNCLINVVWTSSTSGGRRRAHSCERSSDL